MAKDNYIYPAVLDYEDGGITVTFPDLPGCVSCAQTGEEAYYMARDAMRGWLLVSEEYGDTIKEPTPLKHVALEGSQRAVLVDVNLASYRKPRRRRSPLGRMSLRKKITPVPTAFCKTR